MNLYATLADTIRRHPDEIAIEHGDRQLSYRGFDAACAAFGEWLASRGCRPGDRLLLFLRNGFDYPVLLLGAIRAGMVAVPVNAKLHPREVAWIVGDAEPRLVFTHLEHVEPLAASLPSGSVAEIVAIEDFALPARTSTPAKPAEASPDDAAWLFYTSGTTGKPKGATLTHRNLIAASVNCLADVFDFRASDRVLHVAPLSHGSGLYLLPAMARGAHNIVYDRAGFRPDEVLDAIAARDVTVIPFVAPTMIVRLLEGALRKDIGSLRGVIYGGAAIHLEHIRAAVARFGPIFHQLYGQGEAPMTISYLPARDHLEADDETLISAGYVRAGVEVRIRDEDGRDVPEGVEGEVCVRGDVVMAGYWRNPEGTAKALAGGWLRTGDMGLFDRSGRLRILDRRHDTIISGGTNIYPKEIEDVLAAHPQVREAVAFGVPDTEWGESVAVAVVAKDPALDEAALLSFCLQNLASFKKPRLVYIVEKLPKNAYGKVMRRELKAMFGR